MSDLKAAVERLRYIADAGATVTLGHTHWRTVADIRLVLDARDASEAKVREQAEEIERLKKERDGAIKQALEQHRIVQDQGWELRAANGRTERAEKALRSVLTHPDTTGRLQELVSEALRPAAQPETKPRCKCPPYEDCECGPEKPFVEISREDLIAVQHASCGNPRCPVCGCKGFEPCLEGDEGDDPAHNFTCALLCIHCGLPREKHPAAPKPTPSEKCPYCGLTTCRYGADPTSTCHAKGDSCRCSEQPDLPLGHEYKQAAAGPWYWKPEDCGICGQPESAHRRKP